MPLAFGADPKRWNTEACLPLSTGREIVEPIWNRLLRRALSLGQAPEPDVLSPGRTLQDDPQLRLRLLDGSSIEPAWQHGGTYLFRIPTGAAAARLLSRRAAPCDVIGPFIDDRRRLGVAVRRLVLWSGLQDTTITAAQLELPGWHGLENGLRWTDGEATLDLPAAEFANTFLEVEVAGTLPYEAEAQRTRAAA